MTHSCVIGYIGGGKALVLLRMDTREGIEKEIVYEFSRSLLLNYPGLHTGAAFAVVCGETPEEIKAEIRNKVQNALKRNQNNILPDVNLPYTGLTLACPVNGETASFYDNKNKISRKKQHFFSHETRAKALAAYDAEEKLKDAFWSIAESYAFPDELEKLGQPEGENYIAIVHIDGNQMGKKFDKCDTIGKQASKSEIIANKVEHTFKNLLETIVKEYDTYNEYLHLDAAKGDRQFLPIRPLILGGDDITFVCSGKLALTYAQRFIQLFRQKDNSIAEDEAIDSCGGIAILPTAYPFFRGYQLTEQLCDAAKKESRKIEGSCWLDFAILHGEQAPILEQIRAQEYTSAQGESGAMHFGPYRVDEDNCTGSLSNLVQWMENMHKMLTSKEKKQAFPRNKLKEMRQVLQESSHDCVKFMEQLQHMGYVLPDIPAWEKYQTRLWADGKTPFVDAIEMMDYMPWKKGM